MFWGEAIAFWRVHIVCIFKTNLKWRNCVTRTPFSARTGNSSSYLYRCISRYLPFILFFFLAVTAPYAKSLIPSTSKTWHFCVILCFFLISSVPGAHRIFPCSLTSPTEVWLDDKNTCIQISPNILNIWLLCVWLRNFWKC